MNCAMAFKSTTVQQYNICTLINYRQSSTNININNHHYWGYTKLQGTNQPMLIIIIIILFLCRCSHFPAPHHQLSHKALGSLELSTSYSNMHASRTYKQTCMTAHSKDKSDCTVCRTHKDSCALYECKWKLIIIKKLIYMTLQSALHGENKKEAEK